MKIEDNKLLLVVSNETEKERLESCQVEIEKFYKKIGYKESIEIELRHEGNILEEIQEELSHTEAPTTPKKETKKENNDSAAVFGRNIKEEPIKIKTLIGEDNNVVVE